MANARENKSPEELGRAVGDKIEELFSSMFDEGQASQSKAPPAPRNPQREAGSGQRQTPRPSPAPLKAADSRSTSPPVPSEGRVEPQARLSPSPPDPLADTVYQVEALVWKLDWEIDVETIRNLLAKLREAGGYLPKDGHGRTLVAMCSKALQLFANPEAATPPPVLMAFLKESVIALKAMSSSDVRERPNPSLFAHLNALYKQTVEESQARLKAAGPQAGELHGASDLHTSLINKMGKTIGGLDEVNQRLVRILSVLKQGKGMSPEEITRRLETLGGLLSEKVAQLSAVKTDLAQINPAAAAPTVTPQHGPEPDGILLVMWRGVALAFPSACIEAVHPMTRDAAKPLMDKAVINLGNRPLQRLPLKQTQQGGQPVIPSLLVHLSIGEKDFFVLADRMVGYRRTPKGIDLSKQSRLKIGNLSYLVINPASFRSS